MDNSAIGYILSLPKFSYPLGNEKLAKLLTLLGNPEKGMKTVHIAGTNGKGSAAAMLGSILTAAGYKTGVFTSPYIIKFNERIKIGNTSIPDDKLSALTRSTVRLMTENDAVVSQFAFILAIAFQYYRNEGCDIVILEAGLGGRLDATNVIEESLVSVIMSIGLDHTEYLGSTTAEIAAEKCGIIKNGGSVAAYKSDSAAMDVIRRECARLGAELCVAPDAKWTKNGFVCGGREYPLSLGSEYQAGNAATVLAAVELLRKKGIKISENALCNGFAKTEWRARFEKVRENVIVDGAHNPDGIAALCRALSEDDRSKTAVIAMMEDKAIDDSLAELKHGFDNVIVTEIDMPRCMRAQALAEKAEKAGFSVTLIPDCRDAFAEAERCGFAVICGSIYLAGKALEYFDNMA